MPDEILQSNIATPEEAAATEVKREWKPEDAQKKRIDLGRVTAQRNVLVAVRTVISLIQNRRKRI